MANIFFKFYRYGSLFLVSAILLFCYVNLPQDIAIGFNSAGDPIEYLQKSHFFYWSVAAILGVNFLIGLLEDKLVKVNYKPLFANSSWGQNPKAVPEFLKGWFSALLAFINTYLVFVLLGLYNINSDIEQRLDFNYNYLLVAGLLILLIILVFVPYKLLATQAPSYED